MKKVFLFLLMFVALKVSAQTIGYTPETSRSFTYVKVSNGFGLPLADTVVGRNVNRPGLLVCLPADSSIYRYNGVSWDLLAGGGGDYSQKVDSVTVSGDSLFYWINGTSYGYILPTAGWKLTGNATATDDFFGTTNNTPINIRTNDTDRGVIDSTGQYGIGTMYPDKILDVVSTTSGVLIPRMGSGDMNSIVTPLEGELIFNTDLGQMYYYSSVTGTGVWSPVGNGVAYDATVIFSVNADPNTVGTTFDPNTPQLTTVIYVSDIDNSLWVWDGSMYVTYTENKWLVGGNQAVTVGVDGNAKFGTKSGNGVSFITNDTVRAILDSAGVLAETANTVVLGIDTATKQYTWATSAASGGDWKITGNSGTTAGTNFIGTTDAQDVVFKTGGSEVVRLSGDGFYKISMGLTNTATGARSASLGGYFNNATGSESVVVGGDNNDATGIESAVVGGEVNVASGDNSIVVGGSTNIVSGRMAAVLGLQNKSKSYGGTVIGTFNDSTGATSATAYNATNRAFQIGIGTADNARANAMTVLFNGKTGLGTTTPDSILHVVGGIKFPSLYSSANATDSMMVVNSTGGVGYRAIPSGGGGTPGGSNTELQYNNAGSFGGITGATTNGTVVTLTSPVINTSATGTLTPTTGNGLALTSSTVTTGNLVSFTNTGTAAASNTKNVLAIASSGANATNTQTVTGQTISVTNTGTASTNVGASFSASGATNNYGLLVPAGNVGIGTITNNLQASTGYASIMGADCNYLFDKTSNINSAIFFGNNGYLNAGDNWKYIGSTSNEASVFTQVNGTFTFRTAAAGTAGNDITWTTAMNINNAGATRIGDATTAATSSILDITSTTKGLLMPRMTTAQQNAIASPAIGLLITNTTDNNIGYYNGTIWRRVMNMQGADVASTAGAMTLGTDGTSFEITGTNTVTLLSNVGWVNGDEVTLMFTSTATLTHGTATSGTNITMILAGASNFVASADDTITLILGEIGGTQAWREKSRSVN